MTPVAYKARVALISKPKTIYSYLFTALDRMLAGIFADQGTYAYYLVVPMVPYTFVWIYSAALGLLLTPLVRNACIS